MNLFIFLSIIFIFTFVFGHILEKLRIPWIFAALLLGIGLSSNNIFSDITESDPFIFMSKMGLYLLLFLIGFELNFRQLAKSGKFITKATFFIELLEILLIGTALHIIFDLPWLISFLVSMAFTAIGEAILLPLLEEMRLLKTKLGQLILGIAIFDNIFVILMLVGIVIAAPYFMSNGNGEVVYDPLLINALVMLIGLLIVVLLSVKKLKKEVSLMNMPNVATVLPLILSVLFLFVGINNSSTNEIAVLGALFAGIVVRNILADHQVDEVDPQIKTITYGLFAPVFLLDIGLEINLGYIVSNIGLIIFLALIAKFAKILGAYFVGRKELGAKPALFMGVALGIQFSTSIVFLKILLEHNIITNNIYSILIGTLMIFIFVTPTVLSTLAAKWGLTKQDHKHI